MKKIFKILVIVIGGIIIAFVLVIGIWFAIYTPAYGKKYFDLFITDIYFTSKEPRYDPFEVEEVEIGSFVEEDKKRSWPPAFIQLDWEIPTEQFGEGDSIHVSFINNSGKKLYYFGITPFDAILQDYVITHQESIDTIMWNDLEGVFETGLNPFRRKEKASIKIKNPLLLYPGYYYFLPTDTEDFPEIIKEVYGDTVQIRFTVFLFEIWKHRFSPSFSKYIKVPVDMVIKGWEKGNFEKVEYDPESHQEYLEFRKETRESYNQ